MELKVEEEEDRERLEEAGAEALAVKTKTKRVDNLSKGWLLELSVLYHVSSLGQELTMKMTRYTDG